MSALFSLKRRRKSEGDRSKYSIYLKYFVSPEYYSSWLSSKAAGHQYSRERIHINEST
jgi:hypothetical protein